MTTNGGMNRREFLKTTALGAAGIASLSRPSWLWGQSQPAPAAGNLKDRPNILVIMTDEHNASVTGCYGNKIVQTPNLDSLSARGVTFDACYTNSPLCVPARLSFTAGKYASRVSAWNNDCMLPGDDFPSLPHLMNAAGYESILCGKMHYDSTHRYGFAELGAGNKGFMKGTGSRVPADHQGAAEVSTRFDSARAGEDSSTLRHDRLVTERTVEFLTSRQAGGKPFFLLAGYVAPHFPLTVPEKYIQNYRGKVPMPQIPAGHLEAQPRNYRMLRTAFKVDGVPDETVRNARECYFGLTQWVDEEIGKLLGALAASGFADNTVVIYTADHGENMGEHGMWWKNAMYEHAARVPLIVSWPGRWKGGQRRTAACSLVDVVRTIAELGGAQGPGDWNGDSLCAWMDDGKATWKDQAVSQYYGHFICSGFAMLRQGKYKYVYHSPADEAHPAQRELYDLQADGGEFTNLAEKPDHKQRIEQMHAALIKEIGEDPDQTEARCRREIAKGYGRPMPASAKAKAKQAAED